MTPSPTPAQPSRRDVLRWGLGAAALGAVPGLAGGLLAPGTAGAAVSGPAAPDPLLRGQAFTGGLERELHQGGWCWFQAPRTTIDAGGRLWLGTTVGGTHTELDGDIELSAISAATLEPIERRVVAHAKQDDHTSPGVLALGSDVLAAWAFHDRVDFLQVGRYRVGRPTTPQKVRRPAALTKPGRGMSYASLHVVGGQLWLLYRGEQFSWNLLTSPDGARWTARGLVVTPSPSGQRPYLQAASDGTRLHVVVTEGNPFEFRGTSVYAGTIGQDLRVRTSTGAATEAVLGTVGAGAPIARHLTRLLKGVPGTAQGGEPTDVDRWLCDLRIVDRRPTGILSTREPWTAEEAGAAAPDDVGTVRHRYHWIRQRSTGWLVEDLALGGGEMATHSIDYSGLATQDPTNPSRVVISTNVDPVSGAPLVSAADGKVHHELFQGDRTGPGAWTWTPLTQGSTEDNTRPTITASGPHKVLAWMRGRYYSWTDFDTRIVVRRSA